VDGDFSQGRLERFFGVAVAGIAFRHRMFMVGIAETSFSARAFQDLPKTR